MSINKFQEKVFRTGCGSAVLYVCAAVFFGGMFYMGCGLGGGTNRQGGGDNRVVAFQVGDTPVYYEDFNRIVDRQRDQQKMQTGRMASPDALSPNDEANILGGVLTQYITSFGNIALAKKVGVKFTDAQITQTLEKEELEAQIMQKRTEFVSQKKLKADATAAEFDAALKKEKFPTVAEIKKTFQKNLTTQLKDEKTRPGLEEQVARSLYIAAVQASINPSDDELKATYDAYEFKRILFGDQKGAVDGQIKKAQADLKSGTTFEQAIDRYSSEPAIKGKKLSDTTTDVRGAEFDMFPDYRPLKSLKPGQVSDVIQSPQGKAIYKLIGVKNNAPADLKTNKKKYVDSYAMQKAQTQYQEQIKAFQKSGSVVWKIQGLKAIYDWVSIQQDFMAPPAEQQTKMAAVVDEARKAMTASATDQRPAALAWYAAFDFLYSQPGSDKVKLRGERIEVLKAVTSIQPFFAQKLELVDLLFDSKANDEAVAALKDAASSNFNFEVDGERDYRDIQGKIIKLKTAGVLKPADEAQLVKIQQDWIKQKEEVDKQKAEMKKEQEAGKKEAEANAAKQKAETDKQKAEAEKAAKAAGGTKPGTTAPATTPAAAPKGATTPPAKPTTPVAPPAAAKK